MPDNLFQKIYTIVDRIPKGKVATYGQIASMAGHAGAARTVGWAMSACPDGLPWYRVLNAQGRSSFPDDGKRQLQMSLLESEGVVFDYRGKLDLDRYLWDGI